MRHLRPFPALIAVAIIGAACSSSSPGASTGGDQSQAAQQSQGGGASQPAASTGGGGGGGGGGANGGIHYEITGDITKSGDLDFFNQAGVSSFIEGGWQTAFFYDNLNNPQVVLQINSKPTSNIVNYGDGESLVVGTEDVGCTFNYSRNDSGGLKGTIDCSAPVATNATSGTLLHVQFHATVDAHT
jgi:hypothetical protein